MLRKISPLVLITFISTALAVEVELKWDNGKPSYVLNSAGSGADGFGNYFDVATLKTRHVSVKRFRIYTTDEWPNGRWDGMYLNLYDFRGGVPGVQIWPKGGSYAFFKPTGTGWNWYEYSLDFPLGRTAFLAGAGRFRPWPERDPLMVDTNPTGGHLWAYYQGSWAPLAGPYGYSNLMLRVVVETRATYPSVAPSSWGRIKGLYY